MDRLESMRIFVAVAEAQSFATAARQLRLSAPVVTRAVAALEQHLGARLLHRTTRLVRPTEVGERFLLDCRRILADVHDAESLAGGAHAEPRGQLAVTSSVLFGRKHVAPLLLDFLAEHPGVSVRAFFVDRIVGLLDEGLDVAVRIAHLPDSSLNAVRVGWVRRQVLASPAYLAARGTPREPSDLTAHDAVGFSSGAANEGMAPWRFRRLGDSPDAALREVVAPRTRLVANAGEVGIAAALAGRGLARALSYQVIDDVRSGRLQIVLADYEPAPIPIHLVWVGGRQAPAKVRAFVAFAKARLQADEGLNPREEASLRTNPLPSLRYVGRACTMT